jgi:hypothetical protein
VRKFFLFWACVLGLGLRAQGLDGRQSVVDRITQSAADIDDSAVLQRTLYGALRPDDLAVVQCELMVGAARRRVERVSDKLAEITPLVAQGVFARNELKLLTTELDDRRRTLDLAESRAKFIRGLADMAQLEASFESTQPDLGPKPIQEHFDGHGTFNAQVLKRLTAAYERRFGKPLPISANGETAFHKALGFDHRGRVDVALGPDQPEGRWLRETLEADQIPYYAFRGAVAGRASAAHIHIGPASTRLRVAD